MNGASWVSEWCGFKLKGFCSAIYWHRCETRPRACLSLSGIEIDNSVTQLIAYACKSLFLSEQIKADY
jgi:hypothetical protein